MAEIQLLTFRFSPFGQRAHIALLEKKIPFDLIAVDMSNKPQALLEANPIYKKVPAIIHNGKSVVESRIILEYLEDVFPEKVPLLPKDAFGKSKARFWSDFIDQNFAKLRDTMETKPGTPEHQASKELVETFFKTLESGMTSYSADGPFFTGDKFGSVDVVLAPFCNLIIFIEKVAGIPLPGPDVLPRFHKWVATVSAYPSVSSVLPSPEETFAALKKFVPASAGPTHGQ